MFLKWLKIPYNKNFTAQKLKFLDVTKGICPRVASVCGERARPANQWECAHLIAGGATSRAGLASNTPAGYWDCCLVNRQGTAQFVIVWASVQELTPKHGGLSSLHSCPLYTPGPSQPKPAN